MLNLLKRGLSPNSTETSEEKKVKTDESIQTDSMEELGSKSDKSPQDDDSVTSSSSDSDSSGSETESSDEGEEEDLAKKCEKIQIPDGTPEWGKLMFGILQQVQGDLKSLCKSNKSTKKKLKSVSEKNNATSQLATSLAKKVITLETTSNLLQEQHCELKEKILDLEFRQRRNNLVFDGLPEVRNETDYDCFQKVLYIIRNIPGINTSNVKIDRCHRLGSGKNRAIIACFNWYGDVTAILRGRRNLPRGVFVSEDYPMEWIDRRRVLRPIYNQLIKNSGFTGKVYLNRDKLIVDGKVYSAGPISNLAELQPILSLASTCEERSDSVIAFHGIHSVYSNFHPAPFKVNNKDLCKFGTVYTVGKGCLV